MGPVRIHKTCKKIQNRKSGRVPENCQQMIPPQGLKAWNLCWRPNFNFETSMDPKEGSGRRPPLSFGRGQRPRPYSCLRIISKLGLRHIVSIFVKRWGPPGVYFLLIFWDPPGFSIYICSYILHICTESLQIVEFVYVFLYFAGFPWISQCNGDTAM